MSGGLDYHESDNMTCSYSVIVDIPVGQSSGSAMVAIINDDIYEGQEDFFLDLSIASSFQALGILEGTILRATVEIEDNEGETDWFKSDHTHCLIDPGLAVLLICANISHFWQFA